MAEYPPVSDLIPHSGAMVLLDRMEHWADGQATCSVDLTEHSRFMVDGRLATPLLIEHMAQTVAASLGYQALRAGSGVRVGMIIACREFQAHVLDVPCGVTLKISVNRTRGNNQLSHFDCQVHNGSELVAFANLTLYHAENLGNQ